MPCGRRIKVKYIYPAILKLDTTDENYPQGVYLVEFPDLPHCITSGETLEEALTMAEDALNLCLWSMEADKEEIPTPSKMLDVKSGEDDIVTLVKADTLEYRKKHDTRAVRKNCSIPQWLETLVQEHNINCSKVLQNALMHELNIVR